MRASGAAGGSSGAGEAGGRSGFGSWLPAIRYGAVSFGGLGLLLGGIAGTADWPIVGTFFGAIEGVAVGAATGVLVGAAVAWLMWRRPSGPVAFGVSCAVAAAAAGGAVSAYPWPFDMSPGVAQAFLGAAVVLGGAFGPLIAFGPRLVAHGGAAGAGRLGAVAGAPRTVGRILAWGAGLGAALGAVAGLVIGIRAYLPTSPVAAVEGAVLGSVSGVVLAAVAALAALICTVRAPRTGARR